MVYWLLYPDGNAPDSSRKYYPPSAGTTSGEHVAMCGQLDTPWNVHFGQRKEKSLEWWGFSDFRGSWLADPALGYPWRLPAGLSFGQLASLHPRESLSLPTNSIWLGSAGQFQRTSPLTLHQLCTRNGPWGVWGRDGEAQT